MGAEEPKFVYPLPSDQNIQVTRDVVYRTAGGQPLRFDLYRPAKMDAAVPPALALFMNGTGSLDQRNWTQYKSWGRLVTTAGLAGVAFDTHEGGVVEDFDALMDYLHEHAAELHVDPGNTVLYACSANVTTGLPLAMDPRRTFIKAAVIYYGNGEVTEFRPDLAVLFVRAGLDGVGLNHGLELLASRATAANVPVTITNLPGAHHGFDLTDDNEISRAAITQTLQFMKTHVQPSTQSDLRASKDQAIAAGAVFREDWAKAIAAYEGLVVTEPNDAELHRSFGNALLGAGQFRRSIQEYERALELGDHNVGWISYSAATASVKAGDLDGAMRWIERLRDLDVMRRNLRGDPNFAPLRDNPRFKELAEAN
jgi:tetratricopeptide (TPR) repeat protein